MIWVSLKVWLLVVRSRLVEVGLAVRGHADSLLCEGQGILAGTSEPLLLKMNCRESEAHETEPRQRNRNTLVGAVHLSTSLVAAKGSVTVTDLKRDKLIYKSPHELLTANSSWKGVLS